jgi:hypothetical protein
MSDFNLDHDHVIFEPLSVQPRDPADSNFFVLRNISINYKVFCVLKNQTLKSNFSQNRQTTVNSQIISFISFYVIFAVLTHI